jgi:flagellar M-ring protein FliF
MDRMLRTWRALDLRRRIILVAAGVATLVAVLALAQIASRPGMALLYSGLDPATAGEVVGKLEQMGVASEVRGDAIYVAEGARDRVRLRLARDGLPRQGQAGYELLDGMSGFSTTSEMFDAAYWRAKEGELARTIVAAPGVRAARVHIAVPSRRPFARADAPVTASVTVTMAGGALPAAQARSIRFLVALAVSDLDPSRVAVIDSRNGVVLAPGTENAAAEITSAAREREAKLKAEIEQLIAARVGRDRARVSVSVETDREAETVVENLIRPDSQVTVSAETREISDTSEGQQGNVTVASNLPDGDAEGGQERRSARSETRETVNYDYSETRRERVRQPGAIRRISVAVLVDGVVEEGAGGGGAEWRPRPEQELAALAELVKAAIGYDEARGDMVTVESMRFRADATPGAVVEESKLAQFIERNALTLVQLAVLALVTLVLGLTVIRPLLARQDPPAAGAAALEGPPGQTIELGADGAVAGARLPVPEGSLAAEGSEGDPRSAPERLRDAVAERREESVATLKDWLSDADGEKAA